MKQFNRLKKFCEDNKIIYSDDIERKFSTFCDFLIEKNKVMNLTAVTEPDEIEIRHFIDSLEGNSVIRSYNTEEKSLKIVDLGTGAGFPGIPLAIVFPEHQFTLADSLHKRIDFLKETIQLLGINNVTAVQSRAEELGQGDYRESFDLCVSRAVADMSILAEYCLPLISIGGCAILYKSGEYEEELNNAEHAIEVLGGKVKEVQKFLLPYTDMNRSLIVIEKIKATPDKYPRRPGKPSKSPIK